MCAVTNCDSHAFARDRVGVVTSALPILRLEMQTWPRLAPSSSTKPSSAYSKSLP